MDELNEPGAAYQSFTELDAWKQARVFKKFIRKMTADFPTEEKYSLTDQIIRSSRSIGSNIAEGHGRHTYRDQHHFCIQARGSLSETLNHAIDAYDEGYISMETLLSIKKEFHTVQALLNGYIVFLRTHFK